MTLQTGVMATENSGFSIKGINYILNYTKIESILLNCNNISQYYSISLVCPRDYCPIWTRPIEWVHPYSHRGVLTFVVSGLDINGCVLSYFEGTANLHCYTSSTFTTLHCSKVSFLQCCHMKRYYKILAKMWGVYSLLWDTVYSTNI